EPPMCECGGFIKSATISFGQPMPIEAMRRAQAESKRCDLFIASGSSLVVYPAAGFPAVAKQNGSRLVILNREPTDLDYLADLVLNLEIGPTLRAGTGVPCALQTFTIDSKPSITRWHSPQDSIPSTGQGKMYR